MAISTSTTKNTTSKIMSMKLLAFLLLTFRSSFNASSNRLICNSLVLLDGIFNFLLERTSAKNVNNGGY